MRQPHAEDQVSSIWIIQYPVLCNGVRGDHLASRIPEPQRTSSTISMPIPFQGNKQNTAISVEQWQFHLQEISVQPLQFPLPDQCANDGRSLISYKAYDS